MKIKSHYDSKIGFHFPDLNEELNYEIYKARKDGKFSLLVSGEYDYGRFEIEFLKSANYLFLCYADEDASIQEVNYTLYSTWEELLSDFRQLVKVKKNIRFWNTKYFENDFPIDYVNPLEDYSKMIWRKKGVYWVAQGRNGKFMFKHLHRKYIGKYEGKNDTFTFNMPPTSTISKMKENCKNNAYWEG